MKCFYLAALAVALGSTAFATTPGQRGLNEANIADLIGKNQSFVRPETGAPVIYGKTTRAPRTRAAEEQAAPVFNVDGKTTLYYRNYFGAYIESGMISLHYGPKDAGIIVEDKDGNLWIKDIVVMSDFMSYTKLEPAGDNKYVVKTPQLLYVDNYDGIELTYELMVMDKYVDPDDGSVIYEPSEETTEATFTMTEDGKLIFDTPYRFDEEQQDTGMPERVLGVNLSYMDPYEDEFVSGWSALAMYTSIFTPCPEQPNRSFVPDDLKTEDWTLVYTGEASRLGHKVPVGFDGNEIWIGNLYDGYDLWVRGTVDGDKIIFKGPQFMNTNYEFFEYFSPAKEVLNWKEDYQDYIHSFEYLDEAAFSFDAKNKRIWADDPDQCYVITWDLDVKGAADIFGRPICEVQTEAKGVPTRPDPYFYSVEDLPGVDAWTFFVTPISTEDYLYDYNDLFFKFYMNNEDYVFTTAFYENLRQNMTEIPFEFSDGYDFYVSGLMRLYAFYRAGMETDPEIAAVKLCYRDPKTGEVAESEPLTYDIINQKIIDSSSVKETLGESAPVSIEYYDLMGRRIAAPEKGICIRKATLENGSVKSEKVVFN